VAVFESGEQFLDSGVLAETGCLILDVRMQGMDGLQLQQRLNAVQSGVPIVFVTAHHDSRNRKLAIDGGASDFLHKPVAASVFLGAIETALKNRPDGGKAVEILD
jgi:FixJ family two-component response regulator